MSVFSGERRFIKVFYIKISYNKNKNNNTYNFTN